MGRFLPADHSKGDERTLGGYMAVHDRPAALEGADGFSYSVEIMTDDTGDPVRPMGAFLLFMRWRRIGEQGVDAHLESDFLARGLVETELRDTVGALSIDEVKRVLDGLIAESATAIPTRRWWDAMRDEGQDDE